MAESEVDESGLIVDVQIYRDAATRILEQGSLTEEILNLMDRQDARVRIAGAPVGDELVSIPVESILSIGFPDRTFEPDLQLQAAFMVMSFVKQINDSNGGEG